jgi:hypothetical protein
VVKDQLMTDRANDSDKGIVNFENNGVGMSNTYLFI